MTPSTLINQSCRICESISEIFYQDKRTFYKCPNCSLISTKDLPDKPLEENHYKSQWETTKPTFWESQTTALISYIEQYIKPSQNLHTPHVMPIRILDFGSGSGEIIHQLENYGYLVTGLEPMHNGYLKDQQYPFSFDAVVAVEVIENLPNIWEELFEIDKALKLGGAIIISTGLTNSFIGSPDSITQFNTWEYKDDPIHLNFFCNRTLNIMAHRKGYTVDIDGEKNFILIKSN
jgi:SAM-dependent methyltransferase